MLKRYSIMLWLVLRFIRPISLNRLMPALVLISLWTLLRQTPLQAVMAEHLAFVLAVVTAQIYMLWQNVRPNRSSLLKVTQHHKNVFVWAMSGAFALGLFQIWLANPMFSQRVITAFAGLYAFVMVLGVAGDEEILDRYASDQEGTAPMVVRRHLLKLYALNGLTLLIVNEALISSAAPLDMRIVALSVTPIVVHILHEVTMLLTLPLHGDEEGT